MKKLIVLTVIIVIGLMATTAYAANFSDVEGHWAESYINRWAEEKVINGYEDNTFGPNNNITRAEFVAMIMRIFEPTQTTDLSRFTDVNPSAWYYDTLAKGSAMGAIKGYEDNTIRPDAYITRQEAMVILNRILNLTATTTEVGFTDADEIASWAKSALLAFVENGYVNGYEDGSIHPTACITRAEITKILDKAIGKIITESGEVDVAGINGHIVIKAENVTLLNEDQLKKVFVLNEQLKQSLKTLKELVVINALTAPEETNPTVDPSGETKTSNNTGNQDGGSGQGGGNNTEKDTEKKYTISFVSKGNEYEVTKEGSLVDGAKVTLIIDGKTIMKDKVFSKNDFFQFKLDFASALNGVKNRNTVLNKMIQTMKKSGSSDLREQVYSLLTDEQKVIMDKVLDDNSGKSVTQLLKELSEDEIMEFARAILINIDFNTAKNMLENM